MRTAHSTAAAALLLLALLPFPSCFEDRRRGAAGTGGGEGEGEALAEDAGKPEPDAGPGGCYWRVKVCAGAGTCYGAYLWTACPAEHRDPWQCVTAAQTQYPGHQKDAYDDLPEGTYLGSTVDLNWEPYPDCASEPPEDDGGVAVR
jgi:hypothetical protein